MRTTQLPSVDHAPRRPMPPASLGPAAGFAPGPEVWDWIQRNILAVDGPLYNPDHRHLAEAVAAYGTKKLGITVPAGQEAAVLQGYMLAASKAPKTSVSATGTAMDAGAADFVTAFLTRKEG